LMDDSKHGGVCRTTKRFRSAWLGDLATPVEHEYRDAFLEFGATLRVAPIRISHLREVGDGLELQLLPHDLGKWEWWGEFESDLEVRRRRRFSSEWHELVDRASVEAWLRSETERYLARLRQGTS
jgi:hypothetical protein